MCWLQIHFFTSCSQLSHIFPRVLLAVFFLLILSSCANLDPQLHFWIFLRKMASIMENASIESAAAVVVNHPYYPLEMEIASYLANEWTVPTLLSIFFGACAVLFLCTRTFVARSYPHLPSTEKAAIWWLVLCESSLSTVLHSLLTSLIAGAIHLFFEGMR